MKLKSAFFIGFIVVGAITLSGCSDVAVTNSLGDSTKTLEQTQKKLIDTVPVPQINNSQTRKAVAERATVFDAKNKTTYVYLVSFGKVMAFYPVNGQVVSLRSYLTPVEQVVNSNGVPCVTANRGDNGEPGCTHGGSSNGYVVGTPDIDGTYGDNPDGVFFFTADTNAYVEWKGDYMVSDQPLKLATQPELIRDITNK